MQAAVAEARIVAYADERQREAAAFVVGQLKQRLEGVEQAGGRGGFGTDTVGADRQTVALGGGYARQGVYALEAESRAGILGSRQAERRGGKDGREVVELAARQVGTESATCRKGVAARLHVAGLGLRNDGYRFFFGSAASHQQETRQEQSQLNFFHGL